MNLKFDVAIASNYHSNSQKARVLTEGWVNENMFCPRCGNHHIEHFPNNKPVADFYCPICNNEFELKSKSGSINKKVNDGAYDTMIQRITNNQNPDFFFMNYSKTELKVKDFTFVPKHFFTPDIIEKRKPLAETARRAGWTGCNIVLEKIPTQGRISIIKNGVIQDVSEVLHKVALSDGLLKNDITSRGWLFDVLNVVNLFSAEIFCLSDVYAFEKELSKKHPKNNNIQPKIRQQLQFLRDKGFIEFLGNGKYKKRGNNNAKI